MWTRTPDNVAQIWIGLTGVDHLYVRLLVTELHTDCFTFQTWKLQPCFCPAFYPGGVYAIVANVVCIYTWVCTAVPSQGNWAVDVGLGADPSESKCVQTEPRKGKIHILYSGRILYILSEYFERDDTVTAGDIMFNRGIILVDDWLTKASRPRDGFANTKDKL